MEFNALVWAKAQDCLWHRGTVISREETGDLRHIKASPLCLFFLSQGRRAWRNYYVEILEALVHLLFLFFSCQSRPHHHHHRSAALFEQTTALVCLFWIWCLRRARVCVAWKRRRSFWFLFCSGPRAQEADVVSTIIFTPQSDRKKEKKRKTCSCHVLGLVLK